MRGSLLDNYFGFNRQQRNGLLVLICICAILLALRLSLPLFTEPGTILVENLPLIERKSDSFTVAMKASRAEGKPAGLFNFDPNTVSFEQLLKLGFREKTAKTFLKYRERGYRFRKKEELMKIYGVSETFYKKLAPFILIADPHPVKSDNALNRVAVVSNKQLLQIELNSADSITLEKLPGIGPSYSRRIIKYRTILGGYTDCRQLLEVYGFSNELFDKVRASVTVDPGLVKKINLNKDDFKAVNRHPYISYELTKAIFKKRYQSPLTAESFRVLAANDSIYNAVLPYLEFE
jgi:competence protein ComEA